MRNCRLCLAVASLFIIVIAGGALPVFATSHSSFAGSLSAADPGFSRFYGDYLNGACQGVMAPFEGFHYRSFPVEVTATGDYTLTDTGWFDADAATIDAYVGIFAREGFNPHSAGNNCLVAGDDSVTFNLPAGFYTMVVTSFLMNVTGAYVFEISGPGQVLHVGSAPNLFDGRINNWDPAAPLVVYGEEGASGRGLIAYSPTGAGRIVFQVSGAEITAVPTCPSENTLIAQSGAIALYRLSSCEFELHAPSLDGAKTYVLRFGSLYPGSFIHSSES